MIYKFQVTLVIMLCLLHTAIAQERNLVGKIVSSEDGKPISGASIHITGGKTASQSGSDGNFTISTNSLPVTLNFSILGYTSQSVVVSNQNSLYITLLAENNTIDEVVITALGIKKEKKSVGYAVQDVKSEDLRNSREPNLINALAGKVAGVQITSSGGQAGSSASITIRGNSSLTGNNEPLFVIDGIPMDNSSNEGDNSVDALFTGTATNRMADLDPNTIESISVLKGAAASALYGSRGANGVVMITTKKGGAINQRKFPNVTYASSLTLDEAFTDGFQLDYLQGTQGKYRNGLPLHLGGYAEDGPNVNPQTTLVWGPHKDNISQEVINAIGQPKLIDPRKQFYQTGKMWNNALSISGGYNQTSYILSYANTNQNGIVPNNTFKRNNFSGGFSTKLSENVTSATSIQYVNTKNNKLIEGNGVQSFLYGLNFTPINFDMEQTYNDYGNVSWQASDISTSGYNNSLWLVNNNSRPSNVNRFVVSNEINVDLLPWLKLTNRIGMDTYTDLSEEKVNIGTKGIPKGRYYSGLIQYKQWNNDLILSVQQSINENLQISGLLGTNYNDRSYHRRTVRGLDLNIPSFFDISSMSTQQALQNDYQRRLVGVYASATLDYKGYLYINATARNDWSSTLPKDAQSFFYPSLSSSFIFSDAFKLTNNIFSFGKIRASIAMAGNDAPVYYTAQTYAQAHPTDATRGELLFPYNGQNSFLLINSLANNNLKPELITEYELGTELKFYKSRIGFEFSYYNKTSKNQILSQPIAGSSGFTSRVANAGEIVNSGVEMVLDLGIIKQQDFTWNMLVNFASNKYRLKSIADGVDNIFIGGFTSPQIRIDKNHGYVVWGQGFKKNENGDLLIGDNGLPLLAENLGPIADIMPDWTSGIRNTIRYKDFSLSALVDIRQGGEVMNWDLYYSTYYGVSSLTADRGSKMVYQGIRESDGLPNTTEITKDQSYYQNWFATVDQNYVEDAGFIKLRELTLSYKLPKTWLKRLKIDDVAMSATGRNLWIKSDFTYKDPEGSLLGSSAPGFYHAVTPNSKGFTVGVNFKF
ncbi:SusC/RagA family TonB-linked outer membrane protein [Sphingobacterium bovistauri]|uniref:SusC/RagA family TonB-linked outer membrane protein n=1 Tax=Sphingobacterium bovistauri TaxID=2781959 RepID=A0ABS7Z849_9SPHI|nr:SusC/RagA family TonB-linked outer membrane protein [Sphingobacterium bovistauri]MCA5006382.1 SusC/RagA family TonB-linked outer membrane protein [Sphingobacterium bovistauri]